MVEPITRAFVAPIEKFVHDNAIPMICSEQGQRKEEVAVQLRARFAKKEGVIFVGKAQEKCTIYRTEKRRNSRSGKNYPWIVKSAALVNHYYFYCVDQDFGPFLKFCSYFPYNAYEGLDNGILSCKHPQRRACPRPPDVHNTRDAGKRVADLVRQSGSQFAESGQVLRPRHFAIVWFVEFSAVLVELLDHFIELRPQVANVIVPFGEENARSQVASADPMVCINSSNGRSTSTSSTESSTKQSKMAPLPPLRSTGTRESPETGARP